MKRTILIGMTLVTLSGAVLAEGFSINPFMLMVPKDSTRYATKMADLVQNRRECKKFKDEIMSHAKGKSGDGKVVTAIISAHENAKKAGCAQ